ncbi:tryptophan synthase subunit alpha [Evansella sp. AB-P1]|uniref:tryptophan synthase subunit alpha n=1 Tax=Evansella sp. AB-P1 TaxID=3037653 RepID=UPI00241D6E42|nr:tryptophan synthase subunit alpha [Evansella sp. AB-P1]MDG5787589.1 tryptophan synthase subunit alpha [Evansella sp. AB-P1]
MNRLLSNEFKNKSNRFVPYIMAGDPSIDVTIDIALALEDAGVDAIEWGVPFSDPLADGPVIQAAGERARDKGMNIIKAIDGVKEARRRGLTVPVILFTYINPVLAYGEEVIISKLKEAQIDGILIPDLPIEESESIQRLCKQYDKSLIYLITLSSKSRMEKIAREGEGFLYFVSSLGVTGSRESFSKQIDQSINDVKSYTDVPVLVGFGISKREHVKYFHSISDGVIVGSALVNFIGEKKGALLDSSQKEIAINEIKGFVVELIS